MSKIKKSFFLPLVISLLVRFAIWSLGMSSTNYSISWDLTDAGGGNRSSTNYIVNDSAGQSAIDAAASSSYKIKSGFWVVSALTLAPAGVTDLTAGTGKYGGTIALSWTSPGDDGINGDLVTGSQFQIKYSSVAIITAANYDDPPNPTYVINIATVTTALSLQKITINNLVSGVSYWFAIKTKDEDGNWSVWESSADVSTSNPLAYAMAKELILSVLINSTTAYDFGALKLNTSTVTANGFTCINNGTVIEKYSLRLSTVGAGVNWGAGSSPGMDIFVLKAGFHNNAFEPIPVSSFGPEDTVYSTNIVSTDTVYSLLGYESQKGINVDIGENRFLDFLLQTPTDTSTISEQKIRIYITAEEQ